MVCRYADAFVHTSSVELNAAEVPRDSDVPRNAHKIEFLETLHHHLDMYIWLARRYGDSVFVHREEAERKRLK